jgi:hypothetical protein
VAAMPHGGRQGISSHQMHRSETRGPSAFFSTNPLTLQLDGGGQTSDMDRQSCGLRTAASDEAAAPRSRANGSKLKVNITTYFAATSGIASATVHSTGAATARAA